MLQIEQIKALLAEGLRVYRGNPGCTDYRTVWMEDATAFIDRKERLIYAHPGDETGEDWKEVEAWFKPEDYLLHSEHHAHGGHFHNICCWEFEQPVVTKVVKFMNPRPERPGFRHLNHYVVIHSVESLTDEDACERAIDLVLALGAGFDGDTAKPVLVI